MEELKAGIDTLEQEAGKNPTDEEADELSVRSDALLGEWDDLKTELEPLEERERRVAAVREASRQRVNQETVNHSGPDLIVSNGRRDPFADLDSVRQHLLPVTEVRSRAMFAVEQYHERQDHWSIDDDAAANIADLVQKRGKNFGKAVSEQILVTGAPEYLASFESYLSDPGGFSTRAALSLTPANGGYLVPFTLDPTIILTNAGSANPYRQVANTKTTTTNNWNGVTSAGVNAEWTAEGIEAADATPTVGPLQITPQKADAYLFGSFEVLSDSDFAQQLPGLLADAKDRIEESAFAVGTGTGMPKGIIPAGTSQNRAGTAAAGPAAQDVYALQAALPARFRGPRARNVWMGNLNVINSLRNVPSFTGSVTAIVNDSTDPPKMLGKPFYESTSILGVYTTGNKVLAYLDASQYYIVDRVGMSVVYDPIVLGSNRRPTGQGAWYAFWRVGADVSTATAVRVFATLT